MTEQPRRETDDSETTPTAEEVQSAMAVNAIDDDTRTHLDDPDETEDVQSTQGQLEHLDPDETESDSDSGPEHSSGKNG